MKTLFAALPLLFSCTEVVLNPTPEPEPDPEIRVRIATFNVHRFFDTVCDSGVCGGGAFEALPSQTQFDARAEELAAALIDLDADIILLQEVESQTCLDALISRSAGTFPFAVLGEIGTPGSVDVAVLSRVEMLGIERHRQNPLQLADGRTSTFSRELLEVHFDVQGVRVIVYAAHFRSKVDDDPLRRLAEAETASKLASLSAEEFPGALVVLGGDLNDIPGSPPINAIEEQGLLRVAADLGAGAATFNFQGNKQAIDHLMLVPGLGGEYIAGSAFVIEPGATGYANSDHSALFADFRLAIPQ
jgi:endonuclease/exonuclease/phosphatase family metal-dependent hydrolase